jgi:uncharacterized oxidoreductase
MRMTGRTILVTGGTSGIGRALAEAFHARGNRVIVAGRRRDLLDEITAANPGMAGIVLDVRDPLSLDQAVGRIRERFPDLDVLVNNAGISRQEDLASGKGGFGTSQEIVETNVLGVLQMTDALLPLLLRRNSATIITTTSGLAFVPRSNFPTYCASKAFLHSWLQSLRHQLRDRRVEVLELAPPYVQTELAGPQQLRDPHAMPLADYVAETMERLEAGNTPDGEILVERVKALRYAERGGTYPSAYAMLNPK